MTDARRWRLPGLSVPALLFLVLPLAALVARSESKSVVESLSSPEVAEAISLSLMTSAISTALAVVFGTPLGYLLARRRFRGRWIVDTLVDLPMILPPSVAGIALLVAFGRRGVFGDVLTGLGLEVAFTQTAVVLAQLFVSSPYYVRAAAGGFARVDRDLEESAALDGASPWQVFRHITAPLVLPALAAGAVMAWARALGEFGATIIFAGNFPGRTQTMPLAIYMGFEVDLDVALALSVVLLGASCVVLGIVKAVLGAADPTLDRRAT